VFCQIVGHELPAAVVFEDDGFVAFLDRRPLFPGHVLVVPRDHHETLADLPDGLVGPLFLRVAALQRAFEGGLAAGGAFVAANNRVSQSVPHLHVHVVPRTKGDGLRGFFWPRQHYLDDQEMEAVASRIAAAYTPPDA
jgi:histidine triad (HIT) family protein